MDVYLRTYFFFICILTFVVFSGGLKSALKVQLVSTPPRQTLSNQNKKTVCENLINHYLVYRVERN